MTARRICVQPSFYIFLAFGVILIPIQWLVAWISAAVIHELFHLLALKILRCPVGMIEIRITGAKIKTDDLFGLRKTFCALSGPLGGLFLLLFLRSAPRLALCGLIQSLYNIIPVSALDGQKALEGITEQIFSENVGKGILKFAEEMILLLMVCCSLYAAIKLRLGIYPLIAVGMLIVKNKKIPCKHSPGRVQ